MCSLVHELLFVLYLFNLELVYTLFGTLAAAWLECLLLHLAFAVLVGVALVFSVLLWVSFPVAATFATVAFVHQFQVICRSSFCESL